MVFLCTHTHIYSNICEVLLISFSGKPQDKCPFCSTSYFPEYTGTVCSVCEVNIMLQYNVYVLFV